jgi:hypothetical protein
LSDLEAEALRVHERFLVEVIEKLGLCPWAEGTRRAGQLRRVVMLHEDPARAADAVLSLDDSVLVGILIWPRFLDGPERFELLVAELRRIEEARRGARSPFVTAVFHPRLAYSTESPDRLVPLFRHSPDPSLQLIRHAAMEQVRSAGPSSGEFLFDGSARAWAELERRERELPVSERIARDNAATVEKHGVEWLLERYREIAADRDAAYARLGEK